MNIQTYRVKQYNSKPTNVICIDGKPIVSVRGKEMTGKILAYLSGYDVELIDKAVKRILDKVKEK